MTTSDNIPRLLKASVTIKYWADDGYRSEVKFANTKATPEQILLGSLDELARICAIFISEDHVMQTVEDVLERVAHWKQKIGDLNE